MKCWLVAWLAMATAVLGLTILAMTGDPMRSDAQPPAAARSAALRWEYAILEWDPPVTADISRQRFSWDGPASERIEVGGADAAAALAGRLKMSIRRDSQVALLNALGEDGWELVSRNYRETTTVPISWTFKRRK